MTVMFKAVFKVFYLLKQHFKQYLDRRRMEARSIFIFHCGAHILHNALCDVLMMMAAKRWVEVDDNATACISSFLCLFHFIK